jgi:hypothetical protein
MNESLGSDPLRSATRLTPASCPDGASTKVVAAEVLAIQA